MGDGSTLLGVEARSCAAELGLEDAFEHAHDGELTQTPLQALALLNDPQMVEAAQPERAEALRKVGEKGALAQLDAVEIEAWTVLVQVLMNHAELRVSR